MEGRTDVRPRMALSLALATTVLLSLMAIPTVAAAVGPASLPRCGTDTISPADIAIVVSPWQAVLDDDGAVSEHRMVLRRRGSDTTVRTGSRGFASLLKDGRMLVGERDADGTQLVMLDTARACRLWQRSISHLAYDVSPTQDGSALRLAAHEPTTRLHVGDLLIDAETGSSSAMVGGECTTACEPNDGELTTAAFMPAGSSRPVPTFAAGGWPRDKVLRFRWRSTAVPPSWARPALRSAAADVTRTGASRLPTFKFSKAASNTVRYTSAFPTFCRFGIACASRAMPAWAVWIRPQSTDFSWGTLRWCQRTRATGCFDLRRVMIHELGHISGLQHPSAAGFTLAPHETVMHAITPARPQAASARHAFGRCDVATLQELYDVPGRKVRISSCNDLITRLRLSSSRGAIKRGGSVNLIADLRVVDRYDYGLLGGNALNSRSVKLKYRRAGSDDAWSTAWMKPIAAAGRYVSTISPRASWEFKAVFPAPGDEGLRFSRSDVVKVKVRG